MHRGSVFKLFNYWVSKANKLHLVLSNKRLMHNAMLGYLIRK
jgi:hypothetical protein